ncbi:MAG: hypothetical protein EZS28_009056 [Streblomastix strix]|uniref:DDE-1 domain-containing protein n=1 Tax=Streblomastix strix TaxID=222440 RepID=A0A5J4WKI1_9EUKA|nr:MAG: hypothetical protein EZS28_009056 [Streblomastix strix]
MARPLERLRFDVKLESAVEYKIKLMEDVDGVPACLVANTYESGIQEFVDSHPIEVLCPASITAQQCRYKVERDGKLVSVLACIFLNGDSCAPGIVVKRQTLDDNIFDHGLRNGQDAVIYTSKKGYVTGEIFFMWIRDVFVPFIKQQRIKYKLRPTREAVLLLDGLGAHFKDETLQLLHTAHIKLVQLPSHTSHAYQPLDLITFKAMKSKVKGIKTGFEPKSQGDKIQRAVQAIQMATTPFQNMAAFRRAALMQNFSVNPPVAKIDDARFEDRTAVLLGDQ